MAADESAEYLEDSIKSETAPPTPSSMDSAESVTLGLSDLTAIDLPDLPVLAEIGTSENKTRTEVQLTYWDGPEQLKALFERPGATQ